MNQTKFEAMVHAGHLDRAVYMSRSPVHITCRDDSVEPESGDEEGREDEEHEEEHEEEERADKSSLLDSDASNRIEIYAGQMADEVGYGESMLTRSDWQELIVLANEFKRDDCWLGHRPIPSILFIFLV